MGQRKDELTFAGFSLAASTIIFLLTCAITGGPTGYAPRSFAGMLLGVSIAMFGTAVAGLVSKRRRDRR